MRKVRLIIGLVVLVMAVSASWQIAAAEIANLELREDLRDVAAEMGARIGLSAPSSEEELRGFVVQKAESHGIPLQGREVTVRLTGAGKTARIYLAADYSVRVNLLLCSFAMRFQPTSER